MNRATEDGNFGIRIENKQSVKKLQQNLILETKVSKFSNLIMVHATGANRCNVAEFRELMG